MRTSEAQEDGVNLTATLDRIGRSGLPDITDFVRVCEQDGHQAGLHTRILTTVYPGYTSHVFGVPSLGLQPLKGTASLAVFLKRHIHDHK